jgi:Ca2+-binding EF-hand superfamily protein
MGCGESRDEDVNEYEDLICLHEKNLGFGNIHCDRIDSIFKRYSLTCKMSSSQFITACRELELKKEYGPLDHPVTKFYNSFKDGSFFIQRKLSALGILLGKGSDKEKARVLFKIYDDSKDGLLNLEEVRTMLEDLTEIALISTPTLGMNWASDEDMKQDLLKYNKKLQSIQYTLKNFFEIVIMRKDSHDDGEDQIQNLEYVENPESPGKNPKSRKNKGSKRNTSKFVNALVGLEEFIEKFEKKNMSNLCSAKKLRKLATTFHAQTVAPRELVKDYILEQNKNKPA